MNSVEYLQEEVKRVERKIRFARWTGVVLTLIVLVYSALGLWYVSVLTDPEKLVNFAFNRIQVGAPKMIASTEAQLIKSAPANAKKLSSALQAAIPSLRVSLQSAFSKAVDVKFDEMEKSAVAVADGYFKAHSDVFAPRAKDESVKAYGIRVANALSQQFEHDIDIQVKRTLGQSLQELNTNSARILASFKKHSQRISTGDFAKLGRTDQLERILIAYVINNYLKGVVQE